MVLLIWTGINASDAKPKQMKSPGVQQIPQGQMLGLDARNIGLFRDLGTMPMYIGVLELVEVGDLAQKRSQRTRLNGVKVATTSLTPLS